MSDTLVPPHDDDAERALLGSILLHQAVLDDVLLVIPRQAADCFYSPQHREIYRALVDMQAAGSVIDMVTVRNEFAKRKILDGVGGLDYLVQLAESVPSHVHAEHYAAILREKLLLRDLIGAAVKIEGAAYHDAEPATEILAKAEGLLGQIINRQITADADPFANLLVEEFARLEGGGDAPGISIPWRSLDELIGGLSEGQMIVVAGRPSMGKTAFAHNLAQHAAIHEGVPVLVCSIEMNGRQVTRRLLSAEAHVPLGCWSRAPSECEMVNLRAAQKRLASGGNLWIADRSALTLSDFRSLVRKHHRQDGLKLVILDYLQLMRLGRRAENRQCEVAEISAGIKGLASDLNIPIVVVAQLSRQTESRADCRPRMSDLRESGAVEQDADVVMLLYRQEYYLRDKCPDDLRHVAEIIVDKQRNGPTGVVKLYWRPEYTTFSACAPEVDVAAAESVSAHHERTEPEPSLLGDSGYAPF